MRTGLRHDHPVANAAHRVGDHFLAGAFRLRRQDKAFAIPRITHAIFTWPAGPVTRWRLALPFPVLAVDQIWAGPSWKVVSVARGPLLGSDHYPIVAVLTR